MCRRCWVYHLVAWRKKWDVVCATGVSLIIWAIVVTNLETLDATSNPSECRLHSAPSIYLKLPFFTNFYTLQALLAFLILQVRQYSEKTFNQGASNRSVYQFYELMVSQILVSFLHSGYCCRLASEALSA